MANVKTEDMKRHDSTERNPGKPTRGGKMSLGNPFLTLPESGQRGHCCYCCLYVEVWSRLLKF